MKFGVLQFFSWPGRRVPLPVVYERSLERIRVMDQTGYDAVWLAEHHFTDYSVCPSIHMMGVRIADRTDRLRIGMGVSARGLLSPVTTRGGGGAPRRPHRRTSELGGRPGGSIRSNSMYSGYRWRRAPCAFARLLKS